LHGKTFARKSYYGTQGDFSLMRVLVIKTSSMGDVIHTLPALTDAAKAIPGIKFDWVVEEKFSEIPRWHFAINRVIPVAIRAWRKKIFTKQTYIELQKFIQQLRIEQYDFIIDAQGLLKSAILSLLARGMRYGLDTKSARESLAAYFYQKKIFIKKDQHAVTRVRELFAKILNYPLTNTSPDYGIDRAQLVADDLPQKYIVFLHGTTWSSKHWPETYWRQLAELAQQNNLRVRISWGSAIEQARAEKIADNVSGVEVLPATNLLGMAKVLAGATAAVAVDTGLCHLAAALAVPTVSLYGPTSAAKTGAMGDAQLHLTAEYPPCAPCFARECNWRGEILEINQKKIIPACLATLTPEKVWAALQGYL